MANPLAFGFMPMPQALSMNWQQSLPDPSSYDVQLGVMDAMRQNARQNYGHAPFGDSFLRRFSGTSPLGLGGPEAPQQAAAPADLMALQGALAQAAANTGQYVDQIATRRTGVPYVGPAIDASEGPLRAQPWYDEYIAAAQGGANLPMVMGGVGSPVDQGKADAYRENRAQDMAARRNAVQQNAIYENEQRQVRMGDMSENQQYFNELARLQGALGGQQGNKFVDLALGGPQFSADNYRTDAILAEMLSRQQMAMDPKMQWLQHITSGGSMPFRQFMQQFSQQPGALAPVLSPQEAAVAAEKANTLGHGDISRTLDSFQTTMPNANPQELLQALAQSGITRQNLQGYVDDQPSMPYGFEPGPISFLPWLMFGENEEEMKARQVREAYAKKLMGVMGP